MALLAMISLWCWIPLRWQQATAQRDTITVQVDRPGGAIASTFFGLFFEDINFAADGGLYPERVKNHSFEFPDPMMGWKRATREGAKGTVQVYDTGSVSNAANRHYLRIKVDAGSSAFGVTNEGFRGIGLTKGAEYNFSVRARQVDGAVGVDRVCGRRVQVADRVVREGREVDHGVRTRYGVLPVARQRGVRADHRHPRIRPAVQAGAGHDGAMVTTIEQRADEVLADEPGRASEEDVHR